MPDVFSKAKRSAVMARIRSRGNRDTELALARVLRANKITGWRRQVRLKFQVQGSKFKVSERPARRKPRPTGRKTGRKFQVQGSMFQVRPDFVFRQVRLAVFVDGCFWHGCPKHATQPKNQRAFWRRKLEGNGKRDRLVNRTLRRAGWRVLRVWEHELAKTNRARLRRRIQRALG